MSVQTESNVTMKEDFAHTVRDCRLNFLKVTRRQYCFAITHDFPREEEGPRETLPTCCLVCDAAAELDGVNGFSHANYHHER